MSAKHLEADLEPCDKFAMARRTCSRCSFLLPEPDESRDAGDRIACLHCGKVYTIRKEKKNKLVCPACHKNLKIPSELHADEPLRCAYCRALLRLTPLRPETAHAEISDPSEEISVAAAESAQAHKTDEDPVCFGETILIDDRTRRLPRIVWVFAASALLALLGGAVWLIASQIEPAAGNIRGTVYYGEKPVTSGLICFQPGQGAAIASLIDESGSYKVVNVPLEEMRITIVVYPEELKRLPRMSNKEKQDFFVNWGRRPVTILPSKYVDPATTPLKFTPAPGVNLHDIRVEVEPMLPTERPPAFPED